jgi:tetratricopeptide (TPR) repeat protein
VAEFLVGTFVLGACLTALAAPVPSAGTNSPVLTNPPPVTARDFYNVGTRHFAVGNLTEAEASLERALTRQEEYVQPRALYNLGEVRFAQGQQKLKKEPSAKSASTQARMVADASNRAIQSAETALAGNDLHEMVAAYLNGRGMRRDLRAATEAVRRAMTTYAETLIKWRRADGDFNSAAELNPNDTNAVANAQIVEKEIAKLIDSLRDMQQASMSSQGKMSQLNELLQQLKGRIPKEMMPPGAAGDQEPDDGSGEDEIRPEMLRGKEEGPSKEGHEMELMLSSEEAERLLEAARLDGNKRLQYNEGERGEPKIRSGKTW